MSTEVVLIPPEGVSKEETERVIKVVQDANRSRNGSRQALVKLLDQYPDLATLGGDIAHKAEDAMLEAASGGNVLVTETTRRQLAVMRRKLARPGDGELERLLVERAALCWLATNSAEGIRAEKWHPSISTEAADFWDRHVSRLNGDFLKACKMLAVVRRLLRPVVAQVNIADKQVNVAEGGSGMAHGEK